MRSDECVNQYDSAQTKMLLFHIKSVMGNIPFTLSFIPIRRALDTILETCASTRVAFMCSHTIINSSEIANKTFAFNQCSHITFLTLLKTKKRCPPSLYLLHMKSSLLLLIYYIVCITLTPIELFVKKSIYWMNE